ncbi:MAG: hypothetical protein GDA44_10635, partial [Prochloron sp. SP5CPC1]|nr:hypothetical protein [Candidatus Paraprochloron terpiosi SP5CPC1]
GRFVSRDPVDIVEREPESSNLYQFAYHNPRVYGDPTGAITLNELNAAQSIDRILRNAQRLAFQQIKQELIDTARGVAGEFIKSTLKSLLPFDVSTEFLGGTFLSGNRFDNLLRGHICRLIPTPEGVKNRTWFEVDLHISGNPETNGFRCGESVPTAEEFTQRYGTYSLLDRNQNPRIDFIFKRGGPFTKDRNPPAYLSGDVKRSVSKIIFQGKNRQWKALTNYAQPSYLIKNGNRGHQFVPIILYITLFKDKPAHEKQAIKETLRRGVKLEVISFFNKTKN